MGLQLRLRELYAQDETNTAGTEWGSDDMYLAGVALELRGPQLKPIVHRIQPFKVGEFDDGTRKRYDPPLLFDNYGFGPGVFPKRIAMAFLLAEVDSGDDVQGAFEDLAGRMEKYAQTIKADIAAGQGPAIKEEKDDFWGGALNVAIEVITFVYDRWKGDEIFEPKIEQITLDSEADRWDGQDTSPVREVKFQGHGGTYILNYDLHMQDA